MKVIAKKLGQALPLLRKGKPEKIIHCIISTIISEVKVLENKDELITIGILCGIMKDQSRERNPESFMPFIKIFIEDVYQKKCMKNIKKLKNIKYDLIKMISIYYGKINQMERILLEIPKDLKDRLKKQPESMKDFIIDALKEKMDKEEQVKNIKN